MNEKENSFYQRMIRSMRDKNTVGGWHWPVKDGDAVTLYPNIAAEIDAFSGYLWCPAQHAGVSQEIMAAVLEDNEDLSLGEMLRLARLFKCKFDYLVASALQLIDPATNKGKRRLWELDKLLEQAGAFDRKWYCENIRDMLRCGMPVTYASWRRACQEIKDARRYTERKRRTTRTDRRAAEPVQAATDNNQRFNDLLNSCRNPQAIFDTLMVLAAAAKGAQS